MARENKKKGYAGLEEEVRKYDPKARAQDRDKKKKDENAGREGIVNGDEYYEW